MAIWWYTTFDTINESRSLTYTSSSWFGLGPLWRPDAAAEHCTVAATFQFIAPLPVPWQQWTAGHSDEFFPSWGATGETFCLAGSIATWAGRTNEFRTRYFDIFCGSQMGESLLPITKTPPNKKNRIGVALLFFLLGTIGFLIVVIENQ